MRTRIVSCLCFVSLSLVAPPLLAQPERNPQSPWYLQERDRWWDVEIFLGVESEPDYAGSDDSEVEPDADIRALFRDRKGNRYILSLGQVSGIFDLSPRTALQITLEYEEGRDRENPALAEFEEVRDTLEGQISLFRRFGNTYLAGVLQPDILGRGKGLVTFLALGHDRAIGEKVLLSPRIDVSWGDSEHMRTEFGISAAVAAASGLAPYEPGGGLKSATAALGLRYDFSRQGSSRKWSLLADLEVEHYFSKAADSPLIRDAGSDVTYEAAFGVLFRF
ncbi:MAG: MipA/OmpV family protein [Acidobacteriota bacterium]